MTFSAKILADSVNPAGSRLTTMELTYPLNKVHTHLLTHRMFSRNAASHRAMPSMWILPKIINNPFVPERIGKNQKGMRGYNELTGWRRNLGLCIIRGARYFMSGVTWSLLKLGWHKEVANDYVKPWSWATSIVSGVDHAWENFFRLRCRNDSEPHTQIIASLALAQWQSSNPNNLEWGDWHLPLFGFDGDDQIPVGDRWKISAARCGRVSYLTHDGRRDVKADYRLSADLERNTHESPFEHPAQAEEPRENHRGGNFGPGWLQARKLHPNEYVVTP